MASLHLNTYGYSCQFVEEIPKELQTECSICLHIVRNPLMVECCGYRFCKLCIEPLKLSNKRCPLCNCNFTSVIPDKLLQRTLNQKRVYCAHKEAGCEWVGELAVFDKHLNAQPESTEKRMEGCFIQKIDCIDCKVAFQRCEIVEHETNCPEKVITCCFCNSLKCTRAGMAKHWNVCRDYLVDCPNAGCEAKVKRLNIAKHVEERCPFRAVPCKYAYAGCEVKLQLKDMPVHLDSEAKHHLALLDDFCLMQKLEKQELEYDKSELESEIESLRLELACSYDSKQDCELLKQLSDLRGEDSNSDYEILVSNLPDFTTEHNIKSLFGMHGRVSRIELYYWNNMAVVEYEDVDSIDSLFEYQESLAKGLRLRGSTLHSIRLSY